MEMAHSSTIAALLAALTRAPPRKSISMGGKNGLRHPPMTHRVHSDPEVPNLVTESWCHGIRESWLGGDSITAHCLANKITEVQGGQDLT